MKLLQLLFGIGITGLAYAISRIFGKRYPSPITTPVFLSTPIIISVLLLCGMQINDYRPAKDAIVSLLGPATVALAVPLYKNGHTLKKNLVPSVMALVIGSLSTLMIAVVGAKLLGLPQIVCSSLSVKSVTAPVAIELSPIVNGDSTLTAGFVIATGMIGAMLGPFLMDMIGIRSALARGLALGAISHGQGTAQALSEGDAAGAAAAVATILAAILTASVAPVLVPILLR